MVSSIPTGQKRKADSQPNSRNGPKRRRAEIPVQHAQSGELNITSFVKSREFEIKALESSMQKARKGLMSRAFQQLPRHMRRRTASHNVKKIPRRLRKKAEREMKVDNTPTVSQRTRTPSRNLRLRLKTTRSLKKLDHHSKTVRQKKKEAKANATETDPEQHIAAARVPRLKKNKLADPPTAISKYKRRQVNKTWLPTHLWHAKRAHMTRPVEPLWRMAIPLSPTEKSYRPSHRAVGSRGCLAWDTSYMPTVSCLGTEHTLENTLRAVGFVCKSGSGSKHKSWTSGSKYDQGWVYEVEDAKRCIAPTTVIWIGTASDLDGGNHGAAHADDLQNETKTSDDAGKQQTKVKLDRKLFIRTHPAAFHQFWIELLKAAKMQKPQVLVEDLRYEIGSITIAGPGSTEALSGVLRPRQVPQSGSIEHFWTSLAGLGSPASLPARCLLAFEVVDPRLSHPPKQVVIPSDDENAQRLNELIATWPPDSIAHSTRLANHKHRWIASTTLPSTKAVHRRIAATPRGEAVPVIEKDPSLSVILLAQRSSSSGGNVQGSWIVLLPWGCVDAVWRSLMQYPLSSGGTPRFGGLNEVRQIAFEQQVPWFPADMPGTEAGKAWERTEAEKRFDEWVRRPPSRRLAWEKLDLGLSRMGEVGNGWSCDWEYLFLHAKKLETESHSVNATGDAETDTDKKSELPSRGAELVEPRLKLMPGWIRKSKKQKKRQEHSKGTDDRKRRRNTSSPEPDSDFDDAGAEPEPPVNYHHIAFDQAAHILKNPAGILPEMPVLATVRIRLLTKGHPSPAARVYRLPVPPLPSAIPLAPSVSDRPNATTTASASTADSAPPPAQPSPTAITSSAPIFTTTPSNDERSLRSQWLSLVPPNFHHDKTTPSSFPKQHLNHRSLTSKHTVRPYDPPDHIHVLPKNAHSEIIDEFGPKPLTPAQIEQKQNEALMAELMKGDFTPIDTWNASKGLVPCPDKEDLVGFTTSGGYNLAEGCGTAVASLWVQRVSEGWRDETKRAAVETAGLNGKQKIKFMKKKEKEKHLCVVRNAGDSIGRLGVWELCE